MGGGRGKRKNSVGGGGGGGDGGGVGNPVHTCAPCSFAGSQIRGKTTIHHPAPCALGCGMV